LPLLLIFPANRFVTAPRLVCVLIVKEQSSLESHRAIGRYRIILAARIIRIIRAERRWRFPNH